MGAMFTVVRPDGSVEYTDVPAGAGRAQSIRPGEREPERKPYDPKFAQQLIKEAQKRIPKVVDYLEYVDYLRHNSPIRFDRVMNELRRQDPQTWLKLQKYPQFRPLRETAIGLKAGEKTLSAGLGLATGTFTGSTEKWMATTLNDLMKRDRWGPYSDVLGAKASTLPNKAPTYSSSRLGQYLRTEDARLVAASKAASKELELSRAGMRAARGALFVRTFSVVTDVELAALQPETGHAVAQTLARARLEAVARKNPGIADDTAVYEEARGLLNKGEFGQLDKLLKRYE